MVIQEKSQFGILASASFRDLLTDESLGICHYRVFSTDLNLLLNVYLQKCAHVEPGKGFVPKSIRQSASISVPSVISNQ